MGLEAASYISELVITNPDGADQAYTSDDHHRLVKTVLKTQFPNFTATAMNASVVELNYMVGVTGQPPEKSNVQLGAYTFAADSGIADAYVITLTPVPSAYADGMRVWVLIGNANTGASTLNVNSLGAIAIKYIDGSDLRADALRADAIHEFVYRADTTPYFQLINPSFDVEKSAVKDHGTQATNYTLQMDEADFHVIAFSAAATLTIASSLTSDKATVALKNNNNIITMAGVTVDSPTPTVGADVQDIFGFAKSFGQIILTGAVYNKTAS